MSAKPTPKKKSVKKTRAVIKVPVKALRRVVKQAIAPAADPPLVVDLVIVDDVGLEVATVPVPPSEWRRIWNACVMYAKGALK